MVDFLCPIRPGERNEELRIALRSWVANGNLTEADTLWVVGYRPRWLKGVRHLPGNRFAGSKQRNVWDNIRIACEHPDMPEQVVIVNDDFVITEPADVTEIAYRGTLDDHIASLKNRGSWWIESLTSARDYLRGRGIDEPLSYELHRPILVDVARMEQALREAAWHSPDNPPQWRTVYGNRWNICGTMQPDGKIYRRTTTAPTTPFWSTTDQSITTSPIGRAAAALFPEPCRYEVRRGR